MNLNLPTYVASVFTALALIVFMPDEVRDFFQGLMPWAVKADTVKPAAEGVEIGAVWSSCEV